MIAISTSGNGRPTHVPAPVLVSAAVRSSTSRALIDDMGGEIRVESLPDQVAIRAGPMTILVVHGHRGKTARQAARALAGPDVELVIYGHSHRPMIEREGTTILFNPGSPIERRWNPHFGVGLIEVGGDGITPDLVLFSDPAHLASIGR